MSTTLPIDTNLLKKAALVYRAVNHPLRLQILQYLHQKQCSAVTPIYIDLGLVQSVASQHLAILRRAGLVKTVRQGKEVYYSVDEETLTTLHTAAGLVVDRHGSRKKNT